MDQSPWRPSRGRCGQPFVIHLFGPRIDELRTLAEQVAVRLRPIPSLTDIFNNDGYPITELQISPRPEALAAHRMTPAQLYAQIAPLLNGEVVTEVPEGNVPLDLYIRLADAPQKSIPALTHLPIRTGGWTPLGQYPDLKTARLQEGVASAQLLQAGLLPDPQLGRLRRCTMATRSVSVRTSRHYFCAAQPSPRPEQIRSR